MHTTERIRQPNGFEFYHEWMIRGEDGHLLESPGPRYGKRAVNRYVNILLDTWFKKILGAEKNKEALLGILRELIPERQIADIKYDVRKKRKHSPFEGCRDAVFDVECTDTEGARFVVEMQLNEQKHFHERALFYSSFPIQEQVLAKKKSGRDLPHDLFFDYPPVYVVSFLNFSFHKGSEQILYRYDLIERGTGELMTDRLNFIFIEMPNAGEEEPAEDDSFVRKLSWAFTHMSILRDRPAALVGKVFESIFQACEIAALDEQDQQQIHNDMTTEWDIHDQIETAWLDGEEAGIAKGEARGEARGEAKEKTKMAKALKEIGVPVEQIAMASGLTVEEINAL